MTQLKEALEAAGVMSPKDRLRQIAMQALIDHGNSWELAQQAILKAVRPDLALTWALFDDYASLATKKLLNDLRHAIRQDEKARGGGHVASANQASIAPAARSGGGHGYGANHGNVARSQPGSQPITAAQREAKGKTADVIRMSLLETFRIDGRPIGDWQAGEARSWAHRTGRHVRFVELLTANMPAGDPIKRWVNADDAATLWQRAEADNA